MNKPIHPAVAEHVMEENEKLRELLAEYQLHIGDDEKVARAEFGDAAVDRELARRAALSQQAGAASAQDEKAAFDDWYPLGCPGAGVTAHLSARAGFRAGAAWQRTRPAQDELTAFDAWYATEEAFAAGDSNGWYGIARAAWMARAGRPAQTEQHPSTTQQILDLILEQCRYWHGRDEARRGGFACLYAQAKEIADNAAPIAQTTPQPAPSGFRVMRPTSAVLAEGDRWEIYAPCGSGGAVSTHDVKDWVVRKLLDAMASANAAPQPEQSGLVEAAGAVIRAANWWSANEDSPKSALAHFARAADALRAALSTQGPKP